MFGSSLHQDAILLLAPRDAEMRTEAEIDTSRPTYLHVVVDLGWHQMFVEFRESRNDIKKNYFKSKGPSKRALVPINIRKRGKPNTSK